MFNHIGGKIKVLAKVLCWMGIILSMFVGVATILTGLQGQSLITFNYNSGYGTVSSVPSTVIGVIIIVFGSLFSWIGSFFTYGFGELIEKVTSINDKITGPRGY